MIDRLLPPRSSIANARAALPRLIRSAFTENLTYKAAALFLSLVIWILVERQTRSPIENVDVDIVFKMDTNLVRVSLLPTVMARISAPAEDQLKLEAIPPKIFKTFETDVDDSVVVTIRPRDLVLPEGVRGKVLDVEPPSFVVRFDPLMQKTVPVLSGLRISASNGVAVAGAARFEPDSVSIVGRRQVVHGISSVSTEVRDLTISDTTPTAVKLVSPAPGISVAPGEVMVRVPIIRTQPP